MNTNTLVKRNDAVSGVSSFPSLFSKDWFDNIFCPFETMDSFFGSMKTVYPFDVSEETDKDGNVSTILEIALAGISKDSIDIRVKGDNLVVSVNKEDKQDSDTKKIKYHGISHRSATYSYGLFGVDKENIKSVFKNGMLKVILPKSKVDEKTIDIVVE